MCIIIFKHMKYLNYFHRNVFENSVTILQIKDITNHFITFKTSTEKNENKHYLFYIFSKQKNLWHRNTNTNYSLLQWFCEYNHKSILFKISKMVFFPQITIYIKQKLKFNLLIAWENNNEIIYLDNTMIGY